MSSAPADLSKQQKRNISYHLLDDLVKSGKLGADFWDTYVIERPIDVFPKGTIRRFMSTDAIKASEELHPSPAACRNAQHGGKWRNPAFSKG
jgi:hypothetical protein